MKQYLIFALLAFPLAARAQTTRPADPKAEFLTLCDTACRQLNSPQRQVPFYNDSYAVRALAVAYDLTQDKKYLAACREWCDRMLAHQDGMVPKGAYYMNYGRKPGETKGNWYVADSSSIAMGILATAIRCDEPDRKRYLASVHSFADLVMANYIGPAGGVRNGFWYKYDGEWWCCSGLFGSLAFLLYGQTGEQKYLDIANGAVDWLSRQKLTDFKPYALDEMGPTLPMYVLEAYSAGMPRLIKDDQRRDLVLARWREALDWMDRYQGGRGESQKWGDYKTQWGSKFAGLPFHMYVYARSVPQGQATVTKADAEMEYVGSQLRLEKPEAKWAGLSQLACFAVFSQAERVSPGGVYRSPHAPSLKR